MQDDADGNANKPGTVKSGADDRSGVAPHMDVPAPEYRWGGYKVGDVMMASGYINPQGYGPYASADAAVPGHTAPRHPADVDRTDTDLGEAVHAALLREGRLARSRITIDVSQGIVTLTGATPSEFLRMLAQQTVEAVPGVLVVHNHLDLADVGSGSAPDSRETIGFLRTNTEIGEDVRRALLNERALAGSHIDLVVDKAVVTLDGRTATADLRDRAGHVAAGVAGVLRVRNRLVVGDPVPPVMPDGP